MGMDVIKEQTKHEDKTNYIGWRRSVRRESVEECVFVELTIIDEYYLNYNKDGELIGYKFYQYYLEGGEMKKFNTWDRERTIYNNTNYGKFDEYFTKEYLLNLANRPYEEKEKYRF